jgi:hypothetical protein
MAIDERVARIVITLARIGRSVTHVVLEVANVFVRGVSELAPPPGRARRYHDRAGRPIVCRTWSALLNRSDYWNGLSVQQWIDGS